jgi:hypothetical protein
MAHGALFAFDSGQVMSLQEIPLEFSPLFNEIARVASTFEQVVDWDETCFASLLALQLLRTKPKEEQGVLGGSGRRGSGESAASGSVGGSDYVDEASIDKLFCRWWMGVGLLR